MYNKKKITDKPVGKSSGLNHSSSGKASEKHNFPKQNDSKKASDVCPVHKKCGGCQYQGMAYKKQLSMNNDRPTCFWASSERCFRSSV